MSLLVCLQGWIHAALTLGEAKALFFFSFDLFVGFLHDSTKRRRCRCLVHVQNDAVLN